MKPKGDLADWTGTADELRALVAGAGEYVPEPVMGRGNGTRPANSRPEPYTDIWNAARLVELHGADFLYCRPWRSWLAWDGVRWAEDATGEAIRRAKDTLRHLRHEAAEMGGDAGDALWKHAAASSSARRVAGMLEMAWPEVPILPDALDPDPWILNCPNGVLDLRSGTISPHKREHLCTKVTAAPFEAEARHDQWEQFVADVCDGDPDVERFLARAVGCSLVGDQIEERLFFAHGPTWTGKSTFLEAVANTLGDYATTVKAELFLAQRLSDPEGAEPMRASLRGTRFVKSVEVKEGRQLAEGVVKELTGRDSSSVRTLHGKPFILRPTYNFWLAANDEPRVRDDDDAVWRRILKVPFLHQFAIPGVSEPDPGVKAALTDPTIGGPSILAWAVRGCLEWQQDGLQVPQVVTMATDAYRADQDPIAGFVDERCDLGTTCTARASELYGAYVHWFDGTGERVSRKLTSTAFGRRMGRLPGVVKDHDRNGTFYQGVEVRR